MFFLFWFDLSVRENVIRNIFDLCYRGCPERIKIKKNKYNFGHVVIVVVKAAVKTFSIGMCDRLFIFFFFFYCGVGSFCYASERVEQKEQTKNAWLLMLQGIIDSLSNNGKHFKLNGNLMYSMMKKYSDYKKQTIGGGGGSVSGGVGCSKHGIVQISDDGCVFFGSKNASPTIATADDLQGFDFFFNIF